MPTIESVREFWDEYICGDIFTSLTDRKSKEYLEEVRRNRYRYEYHLMPFLRRVAKSGKTVLEIGCGMGIDLAELARLGCQVVGVDISPKSIQVAQRYFKLAGLQAELKVGNAENLNFENEIFYVVYSFGVLHHTPGMEKALKEVYRVLRPGGKVFLMLYSRYSFNNFAHVLLRVPYESPRDWKIDAPVTRTFSKREVQTLMKDFENVRIARRYLFGAGWRPISDILPLFMNDALGRLLGWHWMIEARKPR